MTINTVIGLIPDDQKAIPLEINILDNSALLDAIVVALLLRQPTDKSISYAEMASLLNTTQRTIGLSVNRLVAKDLIAKDDHGRLGTFYVVKQHGGLKLPAWIQDFTAALIELNNDADLKKQVREEISGIEFKRGLQVLQEELRDKFYRPK